MVMGRESSLLGLEWGFAGLLLDKTSITAAGLQLLLLLLLLVLTGKTMVWSNIHNDSQQSAYIYVFGDGDACDDRLGYGKRELGYEDK